MTILAFLQNQWFKDPEGVKEMMREHPERRQRYIEAFLFMGCLTGKRLRSAFGEELCDAITWEEISPEIGGHAASKFPPDPIHIAKVIDQFQPKVIVAFGALAHDGIRYYVSTHNFVGRVLYGPHPADRRNPLPELAELAKQLKQSLSVGNALDDERTRRLQ